MKKSIEEDFWCVHCDKVWKEAGRSRHQAYDHARQTGHAVSGKVVKSYSFYFIKRECSAKKQDRKKQAGEIGKEKGAESL